MSRPDGEFDVTFDEHGNGTSTPFKPPVGPDGRRWVVLGSGERRAVDELVLEAFVGPRPQPDAWAEHINGDLANDAATNLRWATPSRPEPTPLGSDGKPLTPLADLTFSMEGRTFQFDKAMILDGLKKHADLNGRAVRVCRPAKAEEGHKGRIKVQFLHSSVFTFARPSNLFALTDERRAALSANDQDGLALYERSQKNCLGVDMSIGGLVYSTRG